MNEMRTLQGLNIIEYSVCLGYGRKERKVRERERDKKRRRKKFNTFLSGRKKINRSDWKILVAIYLKHNEQAYV